jgi:3-phenylpropionate/trans-cinnamate dioxygenase ferredoxin component
VDHLDLIDVTAELVRRLEDNGGHIRGGRRFPVAEFVTVGRTGDIGEGDMRSFPVGEREVVLARVDGAWYAFDNVCTHMQCPLSMGDLDGIRVECPCHGSAFDVTSGGVLNGPATEPVETFPVRVEGQDLQVAV